MVFMNIFYIDEQLMQCNVGDTLHLIILEKGRLGSEFKSVWTQENIQRKSCATIPNTSDRINLVPWTTAILKLRDGVNANTKLPKRNKKHSLR